MSVRNINICARILTYFTGLLLTNTVAAKRDLLAERTGLGKSVSVSRSVTPVAGPIFETKNRAIFLEIFFRRGITAREQLSRAVVLARF